VLHVTKIGETNRQRERRARRREIGDEARLLLAAV